MARPVDADSAATYEQIIEAALEVLDECKSPTELSMRRVAERAGLSKSAIHYYFGNRTDLLEACLDGYYERLAKAAMECLFIARDSADGGATVEMCARRLYRFARAERRMVSLRLNLNSELGELHPRRQERFLGDEIRSGADALARHIQVSPAEMRLAIQAVASMIVRFVMMTPDELELLTGETGERALEVVEEFVVAAARRIVRPEDSSEA